MPEPGTKLPLVGVVCDRRVLSLHRFDMAGTKYSEALSDVAGVMPVLVPALGERFDFKALLARLDGVLFTGSPSNIEPVHYQGPDDLDEKHRDRDRDSTALPLLHAAIELDLPVLAICRGMQELNVTLGGTLHQKIHEVPGRFDHRDDDRAPLETQYAPAHPVGLTAEGWFRGWAEGAEEIQVNSLHAQGIDRLAFGLEVEATAADGQIEGVRLKGSRFCVGVQWHPEWEAALNPFSRALFEAFGAACLAYQTPRAAPTAIELGGGAATTALKL